MEWFSYFWEVWVTPKYQLTFLDGMTMSFEIFIVALLLATIDTAIKMARGKL